MRKIAVIGQGYVGLPLALAFSEYYNVVGYDVNIQRVQDLNAGIDKTLETDVEKLKKLLACGKDNSLPNGYIASSNEGDLKDATIFIITVPTPIDQYNSPDLSYPISASKIVARILK